MNAAGSEPGGEAAPTRRPTPYDLIFAGDHFEKELFPAIEAEAQQRSIDVSNPDAFVLLAAVGDVLRSLPAPADEPQPMGAPASVLLAPFGSLLFQAFQFWRFGRRVGELNADLLERLLDDELAAESWTMVPPHPAGYLQLPRHRLWSRVEESAPAEPVDGFFWTMIGQDDPATPPFHRLDVLLALGVRAGRPGVSVIETAVLLPGDAPGHWVNVRARGDEPDFANILPGGELQGLRALVNTAEVLKLVSRVFWLIATEPAAVQLG